MFDIDQSCGIIIYSKRGVKYKILLYKGKYLIVNDLMSTTSIGIHLKSSLLEIVYLNSLN